MNKIISIDIYDRDVMVHFGEKKHLKARLSKIFGCEKSSEIVSMISGEEKGKSFLLPGGQMILYMPNLPKDIKGLSVLAHEIFHIANYTLEKAGINLTSDSDEAYSYLIEFLTKKILAMLPISFSDDVRSA
ncbi:MAG: Protein DA1 [Bacteriophage sp.]|nr:MAG: Protein DA1 [Bacteriophage sp.]